MAGADTWIAMNASTAPASADLDSAVTLPLYNITGEAVQASVKLGAYALSQQTIGTHGSFPSRRITHAQSSSSRGGRE
jgi:hypothetical protein